jgi:uncharacterized protein involved in exopolysaccharide biosynthesis
MAMNENNAVTARSETINIMTIIKFVMENLLLIMSIVIPISILVFIICLLIPPTFEVEVTLIPSSNEVNTRQSAAQPGYSETFYNEDPLNLYPQILTSRTLLSNVLEGSTSGDSMKGSTILECLLPGASANNNNVNDGVQLLRRSLGVSVDHQAGIITITVSGKDRQLLPVIANTIAQELDNYMTYVKTSKARKNREFLEERLGKKRQDLQAAEAIFQQFMEENKIINYSPEKQIAYQRLERDVSVQKDAYLTISKELETAKIEEQKSIPSIEVLDAAVPPLVKKSPRTTLTTALAFMSSFVIAVVVAFLRRYKTS